ncbi:hypothetical protein NG697_12700 [Pseudarthrobacter sp. MDT3-26]|uniref:hypothetical protein n=1 Tax=Pseudarthrobacter raffinosi TaxID=2953651 RepID=UPI00208F0998|nr:hypothetical protein [Pseudarthrobacter sp. MDT3-26]MCO4263771.1 hypothetical protein [Pseudarthrobacter sp. MDT3-26]
MKKEEIAVIDSVRGLMDSQRVATYLGVPRATIRSWAKRKTDGIAGVHTKFPDPLPEQLGGTTLWDENEIRAFKAVYDAEMQPRKKLPLKDASDVLRAVES